MALVSYRSINFLCSILLGSPHFERHLWFELLGSAGTESIYSDGSDHGRGGSELILAAKFWKTYSRASFMVSTCIFFKKLDSVVTEPHYVWYQCYSPMPLQYIYMYIYVYIYAYIYVCVWMISVATHLAPKSREISFVHNIHSSCQIVLKICTEYGGDTVVLCAKFQKRFVNWAIV